MKAVKKGLDRFFKWFNGLYLVIATAALVFLVVTCALQVASRYITFVRIIGMEELARLGFVWMVSLALGLCVAYKSHLQIDVLANKVPKKIKPWYDTVIDIIVLFYLVILFYYSIVKCMRVHRQVTIVFEIRLVWLYLAMVVGAFGGILNTLNNMFQRFYFLKYPEEAEAAAQTKAPDEIEEALAIAAEEQEGNKA
ncbi:MAG: TRAP transporter small permease [Lachnospiraceae bacterium]|nr:TRAP transporter small permease [Lachnospiraceae bacterium]